jgi:hypothetical protein
MASFVSALPVYDLSSSTYDKPATSAAQTQPAPTAAQEMKQLEEQGHSANQIADQMGLPLTLVQSELGDTSTSTITVPLAAVSVKA